ncbi:MAG: HNH endonuclease [Candidatus Rokubacteria bacterium RBG_16_73_20]|nr:MAG: HNH endonuclease [Candidatus Rokubacteria bacterium GWA2_73_35]OGK91698.1 MAG: HNH endonuclease [Candidatus Rokubacteria bacterium RBG_16_73_20]HBH01882.1 HNH endonuclease [Candidatus Rokubacteria bacterium]
MSDYYAPVDPDVLRRERAKARELRQSPWWKRRIADGVCHYCRRRVGRTSLTMDHLVPLGRGGRTTRGNVAPACKACNTKKRSLVPVEWEEYLRSLGAPAAD